MLQDSFIETSVTRKTGFTEVIFNTFLVTACIITVFFVNFIPLSLGYNAWFREMSNDLVDCAVINGDNKRDDLVSFSIKDCEYIGPVTSDRYESDKADSHYVVKMTDFKNFDIEDTYWYFLVVQEGAKIMVVFHYKDEMYQVFRRYNPRNTIPMNKLPKPAAKKEGDEGDE